MKKSFKTLYKYIHALKQEQNTVYGQEPFPKETLENGSTVHYLGQERLEQEVDNFV